MQELYGWHLLAASASAPLPIHADAPDISVAGSRDLGSGDLAGDMVEMD
jgi:hypothetical protein